MVPNLFFRSNLHIRDYLSITLVVSSVILFYTEELIIGSEHSLEGPVFFLWAERLIAAFFIYEYLMRWYEASFRPWYLVNPVALIDLMAIIPFLVGFFVTPSQLHLVRTLRLLRLLKIVPYMPGVQILLQAVVNIWPQIRALLFVQVTMLMFSTAAMYEAERDYQGTKFHDLGDSIWFTAVTVTTVGYGDITPVTTIGRFIALVTFLTGLILFGVFVGLFSSAITEAFQKHHSDLSS